MKKKKTEANFSTINVVFQTYVCGIRGLLYECGCAKRA